MKSATNVNHFFPKGGYCGKMMRNMHWEETLLGVPDSWSPGLKTAVNVCLNSRLATIVWWGHQLVMLYNDACINIMGQRHPTAFSKPLPMAWPEAEPKLSATLHEVFRSRAGKNTEDQLIVVHRNGKEQDAWFSMAHCPIFNERGQVEGVFTTIIERTQIVIERRLTKMMRSLNKALLETSSQNDVYKQVARVFHDNHNHIPFTIFYEIDGDTAVRKNFSGYVTPQLAPEKLLLTEDKTIWPLKAVLDANEFLIENISELGAECPAGACGKSPEKVLLFALRLGKERTPKAVLIVGVNPCSDLDESQMNYLQLIVEEITDRLTTIERQTQWIRYANEQSVRASEELEHLRYISSHNLQEPLRKIRTFARALHNSTEGKQSDKKYLEKIDDSAAQMSDLIKDLINYADLSSSKPYSERVDLTHAFESAMASLHAVIAEKHAVVKYEKLPAVRGVRSQLVQLFRSLLENSLKFNEATPVIKISYRQVAADGNPGSSMYNEITFTDNGIGFDEVYANKAFQLFQKLHDKKLPGTGTGLTLCKKIVENHHGKITVSCEANKGTVVKILLPSE